MGLCCAAEGEGLGGEGRLGEAGAGPEHAFAGESLQHTQNPSVGFEGVLCPLCWGGMGNGTTHPALSPSAKPGCSQSLSLGHGDGALALVN